MHETAWGEEAHQPANTEELRMRPLLSLVVCGVLAAIVAALPVRVAAAEPARVLLRAQAAPNGTVQVTAKVVDARGAPVAEVPLIFKARTTFGWLTLLETSTDPAGTARTTLAAGDPAGGRAAGARGEGALRAATPGGERGPGPPRLP